MRPLVHGDHSGGHYRFDIFEFRRFSDRTRVPQDFIQGAYGHVGFSFANGEKILGFGPCIKEFPDHNDLHEHLLSRKPLPGLITDDTEIFHQAIKYGLEVKRTSFILSARKFWKAKVAVARDRVLGQLLGGIPNKHYTFPPLRESGDTFAVNCYNCATYPLSVGLPTISVTGYINKNRRQRPHLVTLEAV